MPEAFTPEYYNQLSTGHLPAYIGLVVTEAGPKGLRAELAIKPHHLAPNGYLHAASIIALADTCAGYGCRAHLPEGAIGFTTIELKSNHLGTTRTGTIECLSTPAHLGRTTQVWDSVVTEQGSGKTLALFRCTQMVLYPR